ncbi:MAG: hypothetical protein CMH57_00590 [Myxococcales bacterium]|nr:hypothetical protein [Myxococcales bacterium]
MPDSLESHLDRLRNATRPEAIFGPLRGDRDTQLKAARRAFRAIAARIHPDRYATDPDQEEQATEATQLLNRWWEVAEETIRGGRYGQTRTPPVTPAAPGMATLRSSRRAYSVQGVIAAGDLADVYLAHYDDQGVTRRAAVKVGRSPDTADLAANEVSALRRLWSADPGELRVFGAYLPRLIETFRLDDGRRVTVLSYIEDHVTLAEVLKRRPDGVPPEAMAWMFNRVLEVLAWSHDQGVVHGAVLPEHVLIHPVTHGAVLLDWSYAIEDFGDPTSGPRLTAISAPRRDLYPPEVFAKHPATPATDIYMAAQCMVALLGGDPTRPGLPDLPPRVAGVLKACRLASPLSRYRDAFELYESFQDALRATWGPPRYHPFYL